MADEARAPLLRKRRGLDVLHDAELGQRLVGGGNERLADVEARKALALEEDDGVTAAGHRDRGRGAGRASADDGKVEVVR